ncbi:MAG: hypothetical protein ACJ77N_04060 [Chloroflexota bacterium]
MAEQLSLRLEPALPRLPDLAPMLPTPRREAFDSPDHLFEPTWNGRRALAFVGPASRPGTGDVRLLGEDGEDVVGRLPELGGLAVRVAARSAILDGELVVVDGHGRIDSAALESRIAGQRGRPVVYLVWDLLHLDGRSLIGLPLAKRRTELRNVLHPADEVLVVPAIPNEGRALFDAVVAQGIGGILARESRSPYLPGVRSRLWRSIAAERLPEIDTPPEPDDAEQASGGAVLAVLSRLPLEDDIDTS